MCAVEIFGILVSSVESCSLLVWEKDEAVQVATAFLYEEYEDVKPLVRSKGNIAFSCQIQEAAAKEIADCECVNEPIHDIGRGVVLPISDFCILLNECVALDVF